MVFSLVLAQNVWLRNFTQSLSLFLLCDYSECLKKYVLLYLSSAISIIITIQQFMNFAQPWYSNSDLLSQHLIYLHQLISVSK